MSWDLAVVGAGMVGVQCALALQQAGLSTVLLDQAQLATGTSSRGMGHLVIMDDDPQTLALTRLGVRLWRQQSRWLGERAAYRRAGTLWLAADDEQMASAQARQALLHEQGINCEALGRDGLRHLEPCLSPRLAGALRVRDDAILYQPGAAAALLAAFLDQGGHYRPNSQVQRLEEGALVLAGGEVVEAGRILLCAGLDSRRLLPELPLLGRKGHLAITSRQVPAIRHQLVELGYHDSTQADGTAVAFNLQPRETGQWLIGSSRQFDGEDQQLAMDVLTAMLDKAARFVPCLARQRLLRCWTGLRPTTPDNKPLLGPWPAIPNLWVATGHEGLGITTAPATARLLAQAITGQEPELDLAPYAPDRFGAGHGH
ncbi:FAD-binding oxidoreductase [Gallaecimonas sp. GXIMD4217]|uniref:NAD(P)/FAD-dependent oxidoreductase n=1 Tax=Gallaecimonas sp. GXIMD4217 TaxID=3131927 RepID=UPI00311B06D2